MDDQGGASTAVVGLTGARAGAGIERSAKAKAKAERTGPFCAPELAAMLRLKHDVDAGRIVVGRKDGSNAVVAKFLGCSTSRVRDKLRSMGKGELEAAFASFDEEQDDHTRRVHARDTYNGFKRSLPLATGNWQADGMCALLLMYVMYKRFT
jgi:hypothetical protein